MELDKKKLKIFKNKQLLMKGFQNMKDGLWDILVVQKIDFDRVEMPQMHPGLYK